MTTGLEVLPLWLSTQSADVYGRRLRELTAVGDDDGLGGLAALAADSLNRLDHVHASGDGAEDHVLPVEPVRLDSTEEELRAVGAGPCVGHGERARARVLEREVLVGELGTVDGLAARAIAAREVTALAHELRDYAMEGGALEVERLAAAAHAR